MRTVLPNIWMLLLRLVLLTFFIYIYQWPLEKIKSGQFENNPTMFLLGFILVTMFPAYILWTLFGILWITISDDKSTIHFHYFYKTLKTSASDLNEYYRTIHKTKISNYKGLLIKLKSNKVIELTEYNLKSLQYVNEFLATNKIPLKGDKVSWFPLTRKI